ncbi:unnamed protein product [Prorocentrum cordatum]|uniref:Hexosyltransferase n=1 Tax=Prorocentrum cordatum TaxID=2364126 RepID=A0ABN9VK48_9DINO|nr:unnamed protein product [Polarella glacialis]
MSRSRCTCHSSPTAPPTRRGWPRPCCTAPAGLGPITLTWLRVHCSDARLGQREEKERLLQRVYPQLRLLDVNVSRETPDISWIKPLAFQQLLGDSSKKKHSSIGDDAVVAMLDADFLFMSKLRVDDLAENSLLSMGSRPAPGSRAVLGMQGVVQRYECRGFAGAPYIFTAKAWRALLPAYAGLRFEARPNDWGSEQNAWVIAAQLAGVRYMPFDHFMISDMRVHLPYPTEQHPPDPTHGHEGWPWVERFMATEGGDACAARVGHGDAPRRLPTFLHTVRPWNPEQQNTSWQFSKYQVPPGWSRQDGEGILDCDMPLLAEPARDYVRVVGETPLPHPNRTQVRAARRRRLEAWTMCGIIHGLNDMLMDVKKLKCPQGFNDRRALKIEGHWNNRLLEPYAPEGGDAESVRRCSVGLTCTRGIAPLGGDGQPAGQHSFAARGGQRAAAPLL